MLAVIQLQALLLCGAMQWLCRNAVNIASRLTMVGHNLPDLLYQHWSLSTCVATGVCLQDLWEPVGDG